MQISTFLDICREVLFMDMQQGKNTKRNDKHKLCISICSDEINNDLSLTSYYKRSFH